MKKLMEKGKYPLIGIGEFILGIALLLRPAGFTKSLIICMG